MRLDEWFICGTPTSNWKLFGDIGVRTKQVVGIIDKKAEYIDINSRSRENVLDLYEKFSIEKRISNLRLFESDKITAAVHWVPILFPIDTLKQYLETRHGSVLRLVSKVDKMGFEMEFHHFKMRKDDLSENPIGRIGGQEFLIRYKGQIETCQFLFIYMKPRNLEESSQLHFKLHRKKKKTSKTQDILITVSLNN